MSVSPARWAAFRILSRLSAQEGNAADLLHSESVNSLTAIDQALATELVYGILRQQLLLDWVLSHYCKGPLDKLDPPLLLALRLGAYQLCFLSRVPQRAAVHESVELVKKARVKSATGMVNAILRKIALLDLQSALSSLDLTLEESLSIQYSHPQWLIARWKKQFGEQVVLNLLQQNNQPPTVYFRSNVSVDSQSLLGQLEKEDVLCETHPLVEGCWKVAEGDLRKTKSFEQGEIFIQDAASQVVPFLLDISPGDLGLDVCAAPGGKLSQMARLGQGRAWLVGSDISLRRQQMARHLHSRFWPNLALVVCDATQPLPFATKFDKILVDAPCSGTGTLQRNPDIRWRLSASDLTSLASVQSAILDNASNCLKPGGTLVYSTCSLEEEENEQVIRRFLQQHAGFTLDLPSDARFHRFFDDARFFHLLPSTFNCDGFFAAILRRGP